MEDGVGLLSEFLAQNIEAEENVLGAMLLSEEAVEAVQEHVRGEDFYRDTNGLVFNVIRDMHDRELPIDPVSVSYELDRLGKLESIGGNAALSQLAFNVTATSNAAHHAKIVHENAVMRGLTRAGTKIQALGGGDVVGTIDELIGKAEEALSEATMALGTEGEVTAISEGLSELLDDVRETCLTGEGKTGLPTGFDALDAVTQGFNNEQLIILAARTGEGKSTLALNIAENFSDRGDPVLFVSLEMSKRELQIKGIAREGKLDSKLLLSGQLKNNTDGQQKVAAAAKLVARRTNLYVEASGYQTVASLRALTVKHQRQHGIKLLVVDYLQLITPPKAERHSLAIGEISRSLKLLAKRLGIPILAVCQLNREGAKSKPELYHLKESGSLEQDADMVIFLHDPKSDGDSLNDPDGAIDIIVAKNRAGGRDTVTLDYVRKYSSFRTRRLQNGDLA